MCKIIDSQTYSKGLALCQKGKHKLRENKFGVTWCVRCGLLSTSIGTAPVLKEEDKIKIVNKNE